MTPLYIFDFDGTISLNQHRQHLLVDNDLISDDEKAKKWDAFFEACDKDEPNLPVLNTMKLLHEAGAEIWIWSGRSDSVKCRSVKWLVGHRVYHCVKHLRMRHHGDHTPDHELKMKWLNELNPQDEDRLVAIFDDRDSVVQMWRSQGIPCFQVAKGSF